jgi:putative acetyltransferase
LSVLIREIEAKDNRAVAELIRKILIEFKVPKVGTAYEDKDLDQMYETYQHKEKGVYYVLEEDGVIIGSAGVCQLDNYSGPVCELQKMYFLEQARGRGLGAKMMKTCLDTARELGFEQCYLETMHQMEAAQILYRKTGFNYIDGPMGDTGHHSCPVHMIIDL